jgi:murein DD-endopeptidase MepM/ murein hydrolase activator NlpD
MRKNFIISAICCAAIIPAHAQTAQPAGNGGGEYKIENVECVSPALQQQIFNDIQNNIALLQKQGKLSVNKVAAFPKFKWPLKQVGTTYKNVYGISNYVDHDTAVGSLQDWNCGTRTYDVTGYNHKGMDIFLWPFPWKMKNAGTVNIVAAAPGVIVGKYDGNPDASCSMSGGNWNAVYVRHADGSIAWYGHMKKNSLTTKVVGDSVVVGEKLGKVGSSGNSTGPHLHFEVYNSANNLIDPYKGTCNTWNTTSWWQKQLPYYDSHLNYISTGTAAPVYPSCPGVETPNEASSFVRGNYVYFSSYFHDQQIGQTAYYKVLRPNNTVWASWSNAPTTYYAASYWYWYYFISATEATGTWKFQCVFNGDTINKNFTVTAVANENTPEKQINFTEEELQVFPTSVNNQLHLEYNINQNCNAIIIDVNGRLVKEIILNNKETESTMDVSNLKSGLYMIRVETPDGNNFTKRFIKN